jgi:hypothetical protein
MSDNTCIRPDTYFQTATDITRLFDNLQALIPGVTTDVVSLVIWNTIEDFYQRSTYRREHVYWQLNPLEYTLQFDPYDKDWRVCRFLGFRGLSNVKFVPPGQVFDLTCPCPETLREGEALLALKPNNLNTLLPYDVWTNHFETLLNGAMERLFYQPGKPWSDVKAMALCAAQYRRGVASARAEAQAGHVREGSSWQFPYFAMGGHASGR